MAEEEFLEPRSRMGRYRVEKINAEGTVLERYSSAAEAARQNYMSIWTVLNRCKGKTKNLFRDGFSFRFFDEGQH